MEVHLQHLFSRFQQQFGAGLGLGPTHGTCVFKVEGASAAFVKSLFAAAAAFFRSDPWRRLRPGHLLGVRAGKDADWPAGKRQPFPCAQLVGGDGGDLALHLFRSEHDALRATAPAETRPAPNVEILRVVFLPEHLLPPSTRRMAKSLSLPPAGGGLFPSIDVAVFPLAGAARFRNPSVEELRFLFAFLKAAPLIHALLRPGDEIPGRRSRSVAPFIETVDVDWPPEICLGPTHVAVTLSHPPGESSTPARYFHPPPEEEIIDFSLLSPLRQCALCGKEGQGDEFLCCGRCRAAIYCSSACQRQHWKAAHRGVCGLYKAMMDKEEELAAKIFLFPCELDDPCKWLEFLGLHHKGMWKRVCGCYSHCPFGLLNAAADGELSPEIAAASSPLLPSGWQEYYNLKSLPLTDPAAVILSHPLTVYHVVTALAVACKNRLARGEEVVVHYVGPEAELDWLPAFAAIGGLVGGGRVEVFMVGPEVPAGKLAGAAFAVAGDRVMVTFVRGLYQEECAALPLADVVVALNCGMESAGEWGGALETIKAREAPTFFTDRSEIACAAAKQVVRATGLHVSHPVTPNPFRSPVRERAPSHNLPCFSNGFIFGVNT